MRSHAGHAPFGPSNAIVILGATFVVLGGLVAAVTGPMELMHGSWLAAYLVLVCGVAQFVIGIVESVQGSGAVLVPRSTGWTQLVCLNVGNAAVIVGTLTREPLVVDAAVVLLLVAFGIALFAARPEATQSVAVLAGFPADGVAHRVLTWTYRVFLVLLLVSLPVGAVLAHIRAV